MYNKCNHIILIICSILLTVLFSANTSALELPKIEEYKLDNGMRILISPNYDYPTVYCHLFINSGEIYDTLYGGSLSDMMYWSMFDGTTKYPTKIKIKEKIRELGDDGGRFNTRIMDDVECEIGSYFLKEDIKPALELYAERQDFTVILAGELDDGNPTSVSEKWIKTISEDSPVRWIGFVDDAPKLITNCDFMIRIYDITKLHGEICFYAYKQIQNIL